MVSFDELKKKAAESASSAKTSLTDSRARSSGPKTKYTPSRIGEGRIISAEERAASSKILNAPPAAHHRPPPPPRRTAAQEETPTPASPTPVTRPALPTSRSSALSRPAASTPPLPTRKYSASPVNSDPTPPRGTPAPPYSHAVAHDLPAGSPFRRFSEYTEEDKQEFFSMLDEFFSAKLNSVSEEPNHAVQAAPPPISTSTRPSFTTSPSSVPSASIPSYPPPQSHSSSALSILHYVLFASYASSWYTLDTPMPEPLTSRNDMRFTCSWSQSGDSKTVIGCALFGDASIAWWRLGWKVSEERSGRLEIREGRYRGIPAPWDGDRLYEASELYGPLLVDFALKAVQSRKPVRRGECWDVAAAGLDYIKETRPDLPSPFPSIGRTHGHLIFYGRAGGQGLGKWRGGDAYVRPGDIVEWRTVKIREVGMGPGSYSTLGDPDHTAVITQVGTPTALPADGQPYAISSLVSLTVVEQSLGSLPAEKTYDLAAMEKGEIWIYRPVMQGEYIGAELSAAWPPNCETWQVGQLGA